MHPYHADWEHVLAHPRTHTLVSLAISEDLETVGDVSSDPIFSEQHRSTATLTCRESATVCGLPLAHYIATQYHDELECLPLVDEGAHVNPGQQVATLRGPTREILKAERTILNFLTRLSAIATHTRQCVDEVPADSPTKILDTRKTLPGYRWLDKLAVHIGGGENHRVGLYDMIMIKDNHIAAAGGISNATHATRTAHPDLPIEIEVDTLEQLDEALSLEPDMILLDNFTDGQVKEALSRRAERRTLLEASGGITHERIGRLAALGVDRISLGALTHTIDPIDFGLDDPTPCT